MSDESSLLMPFVNVTSAGGRYDDEAYTAGFEIGSLWTDLQRNTRLYIKRTVRSENVAQADLVAMNWNYTMKVEPMEDAPEWSHVTFTKADVDAS